MRLTTIVIMLCAVVSGCFAQTDSIVVFTPENLSKVIDERSSSIRLAALVAQNANQDIAIAKDACRPDINASWQVGYLGNGYLTDRDFSSGMGVSNPHFVNNLAVEAVQTIYSGGAITEGIKMAELRAKMAEISLHENQQQMRFVMLARLIDLHCLYKQREVIEQNIALAHQVLELMQQRIAQGVLLQNDYTRYQLQVANLGLQRDRYDESIHVINSSIANALGYPENTRFDLTTDFIDENYPLASLPQWKTTASEANTAIGKAQLGIDMSQTGLRLANAEKMPRVSAFLYGQFNSPITTEVPVINKNIMYWGFGVNVSYSLSSLFKTDKKISRAQVEVLESQKQLELATQNVTDQVTEAYEAFQTAQSTLHTQRYNLRLAEQNYDIINNRFGEGMALVTDLVDAANLKIAAQTGIENAQSQLLFCLYRLKYISNSL